MLVLGLGLGLGTQVLVNNTGRYRARCGNDHSKTLKGDSRSSVVVPIDAAYNDFLY